MRSTLANQSFMGESKCDKLSHAKITLVGGGLDIESTIISLIGLGIKSIQHFDNCLSRKEPSFLASFAQANERVNKRIQETITQWFPQVNYTAICAPPINYLITEFNPDVILTNTDYTFERTTIYSHSTNTHLTLSEQPIKNLPTTYNIHTKIILGSLAADEARKRIVKYHNNEELITQKTSIPLTHNHFEKSTNDSVLIVGAGGIGTYTALAQTLSHTKNITIIDPDIIEEINLNRQLFYAQNIGKPKAQILSQRLNKINKFIQHSHAQQTFLEYSLTNKQKFDIIFCCTDNYSSRLEVAKYCEKTNTRLIEAGCTPTTAIVSEYVPSITQTITQKRSLEQAVLHESQTSRPTSSCAHANPSIITPNLIAGTLQSYFANRFLDTQKKYHRLQRNFCFNSHLNSKFYEE